MKKWLRRLYVLAVFGAAAGITAHTYAQTPLAQLMRNKLLYAQRLLEGIALADFTKISKSADELIQLSKTAEWLVYKTPRYEVNSNEFRRAAEKIAQKAQAKNIDGVALAYVDLTLSCVRCHEYVREVRDARLRMPALPATTSLATRPLERSSGE
jgi:hypothetical protein